MHSVPSRVTKRNPDNSKGKWSVILRNEKKTELHVLLQGRCYNQFRYSNSKIISRSGLGLLNRCKNKDKEYRMKVVVGPSRCAMRQTFYFHPFGIAEMVTGLSRKEKTEVSSIDWHHIYCVGQIRIQIGSTISRRRTLDEAKRAFTLRLFLIITFHIYLFIQPTHNYDRSLHLVLCTNVQGCPILT